jgi:cell wall-associated NlpC family hydrolase
VRRVAITVTASLALAGCGSVAELQNLGKTNHHANQTVAFQAHPQVVEPVAGASAAPPASPSAPSSVSVTGGSHALAQPVSLETIKQELASSGLTANQDDGSLTAGGLAIPPVNAPQQVQEMIDAGNEIAHLPYRFGGGHGTFIDTAYDCSGSLSFVMAAAGLLKITETSGQLESYGDPGPGKWVTIFATGGHTFAYIAGLRFDTVALAEGGSRWSNRSADEPDLGSFVERHPPGL